eukprot:1191624-Prymnesium_polylepis.1
MSGGISRDVVGGIERSWTLSRAVTQEASWVPDPFNEPVNSSSGTLLRLYCRNIKNVTEMLYGVAMGVWSGSSGLI